MLMVDEAHATGVFGPSGSGLVRQHGLEPCQRFDGTRARALADMADLSLLNVMREWLVNRARRYLFDRSGAGRRRARVARWRSCRRSRILAPAAPKRGDVQGPLKSRGLDVGRSESQDRAGDGGDDEKGSALSEATARARIIAVAIPQPTVPRGRRDSDCRSRSRTRRRSGGSGVRDWRRREAEGVTAG